MDAPLSDIQAVEQFHLLFLSHFGARIDKQLYALKGGCNLRFYWKSIRYSEDLDFDIHIIARITLQKKVNGILKDLGFARVLTAYELGIVQFSEPKQTDTTQRWKVKIQTTASGLQFPTKIEFSRRKFQAGLAYEAIDPEIIRAYNLRPIFASHYDLETAFAQKFEALVGRSETQARDVFDLAHLFDRGAKGSRVKKNDELIKTALNQTLSIPFAQFKSQVVAYLAGEYHDYYSTKKAWETLQEKVVAVLETL